MKLVIFVEDRCIRARDGSVWTMTPMGYAFWLRYRSVFRVVTVAVRVRAGVPPPGWRRVDGDGVEVFGLPYYHGPFQYVTRALAIRRAIKRAVLSADAAIFRVPSPVASRAARLLLSKSRPYAVEVVGDPFDMFSHGGIRHILRLFFRWLFTRDQKYVCGNAAAVAYVGTSLAARYPAPESAFVTFYSSVELTPEMFASARTSAENRRPVRLITVGSMDQMYKGHDVLIHATRICLRDGLDLHLTLVGEGKHRGDLERLAAAQLGDRVTFTGRLEPGWPIMERLDSADVFVLPSRTEGLPRAMLEAMARGLPCLGTAVGGIPELLEQDEMCPPNDAKLLCELLRAKIPDQDWRRTSSARNVGKARAFESSELNDRRQRFYAQLQTITSQSGPGLS